MFCKIGILEACNFIKKDAPVQIFSYELFKIFKKTFFHRTTPLDDCFCSTKSDLYLGPCRKYMELSLKIVNSKSLQLFLQIIL